MKRERLDAVWAAVYVRVLSAVQPDFPSEDHSIHSVAEMLATPTEERMEFAIAAADMAVKKLAVARRPKP